MRSHLLPLLFLVLACPAAFSAESCTLLTQQGTTLEQFVGTQLAENSTVLHQSDTDGNECFPQSKSSLIFGSPVCYLGYSIPARMAAATSIEGNGSVDVVLYGLRGTKQDVEFALSYFGKYKEITDSDLKRIKGPRFFGTTHAWKSGNQYIILGQHEPGYDPVEMSLYLVVGTEQGIEFAGVDLNACK
jgi:hypothetical protein